MSPPRYVRKAIQFEKQQGLCWLCDEQMVLPTYTYAREGHHATWDHLIPRVEGGTRDPRNLKLAHRICNSLRGDVPVERAREWVRARLNGLRPKHEAPATQERYCEDELVPYSAAWLAEYERRTTKKARS